MSNTYKMIQNFLRILKAIKNGATEAYELREIVGKTYYCITRLRQQGLIESDGEFYKITDKGHLFLKEGEKYDTRTSSTEIY